MSIANLIRCTGLVTFGNELSVSEGSLRQALNVNIDENGVITPRRGFNDYGLPTTGSPDTTKITTQLMQYKNSVIRQFDNTLEYEDTSNVFQSVNGTYTPIRSGFRTKYQEANSNLYFTSDEGIKKISETSQANLNANMVTNAGGLKAGYSEGIIVPTVGGFLPPESKVAYRVLFGTRDNTNNLIFGSPSSRFVITNFAEDQQTFELQTITFSTTTTTDEIANGDHFILYSGSTKYVVWFDIDGLGTQPKTSSTIGATYIKVDVQGITDDNDSLAAFTANEIANNVSDLTIEIDGTVSAQINITQTTEGDVTNITGGFTSTGASASTRISTSVDTEGETVSGTEGNVEVTTIIPSEATVDYFYQIYRTAPISVSTGLTINDIDPGDEMNLVYEAGLTTEEINAGEISVVDTTPESFRNSALPLYTNEASGDGILQANETPPIALDLELFKNHMFYANTKQRHRLEFTVVSVDNLLSGSSKFIVGNEDILRTYTFVGTTEVNEVTVDSVPSAGDYLDIYSANDRRRYYVYFGGTGDNPEVSGAVGYRVALDGSPTTSDIATRIEEVLSDNVDFNISTASNVLTFTYANNGDTTGISNGMGSSFSFNISTLGAGEDTSKYYGGDILLSGLVSVGQAIDETARSLVKVISSDPNSPVNAYYLSTGEELPGNILLEARSLEDQNFYVAVESGYAEYDAGTSYNAGDYVRYQNLDYVSLSNSNTGNTPSGNQTDTAFWAYSPLGDEFTPEIPKSITPSQFEESGSLGFTTITYNDHGYSNGDSLFIGYFKNPSNPGDPESFSGIYTISNVTANTFDIEEDNAGVVAFSPSFMSAFEATFSSDNEEIGNRVYYSKFQQPEAVPTINFIDVGPQDSEIKRILALRDELYIMKEDGIYVISGSSAPDPQTGTGGWSVRLIDSAEILAPDSAVVLNNQIYCLSDQGIIRVSGSSAAVISRGIENRINEVVDSNFDYTANTFGVAYENDRAYILFTPQEDTDTSATQAYRYNIFEKTWSRWEYEATCGLVMKRDNKLYVGNGDRNYISQERKNNNRTDYSDRNFSASITTNGVGGNILELSSLIDVQPNDVITQTQDVTIYYINWKLLKKMDFFDTGITPPAGFDTMFEAFEAKRGNNLVSVMQNINDHLFTLDPWDGSSGFTNKTFTTSNIKSNTELLVTELNNADSITSLKTYKNPQTVTYEVYITEIDTLRNQVTVQTERPFIEGSIQVYKGYTCTAEWNPLHFGNPGVMKQISHMMIMFDQNNFNAGLAKFYTDVSRGVVEIPFNAKGVDYWGDDTWGTYGSYWGGTGNDVPFRTPVPRGKQRCRYISIAFEHRVAREQFRVIGVTASVRQVSDKAYKQMS